MRLGPDARVAVFYAPEPDDPLAALGVSWLGRDAESGVELTQPALAGIAEITADPRLYGLHATLKPPMRVRPEFTWDDLIQEAAALARGLAPFNLPRLELANLGGFLALREAEPSMRLQAMADLCVAVLDRFRMPPAEAELARRRRAGLSPAEEAMLRRYGYPYVFGTWRFHITLTRRLDADERARMENALRRHLAPALTLPRQVRSICLFLQPEPEAPFVIRARIPLQEAAAIA